MCAWLALGPCWGDCVDTAEAGLAELRLEGRASGDDLSCLHVNTSGAGNCQHSVGFTEDLLCIYRIVTGSRNPAGDADTHL